MEGKTLVCKALRSRSSLVLFFIALTMPLNLYETNTFTYLLYNYLHVLLLRLVPSAYFFGTFFHIQLNFCFSTVKKLHRRRRLSPSREQQQDTVNNWLCVYWPIEQSEVCVLIWRFCIETNGKRQTIICPLVVRQLSHTRDKSRKNCPILMKFLKNVKIFNIYLPTKEICRLPNF